MATMGRNPNACDKRLLQRYIFVYIDSYKIVPGTINKHVSLYSIFIIMMCSFITGAISGKSNIVTEDAQIKAYKEYYIAAETLLDSLGIYIDAPILDMGAGYGPIGIVISKLYNKKTIMCEINERAYNLILSNILII